jgi:hypothetical protein
MSKLGQDSIFRGAREDRSECSAVSFKQEYCVIQWTRWYCSGGKNVSFSGQDGIV